MSAKIKKKTRASFGATAPPFIDYLKDILRRYPDGGQILKELIQNADDAQATEVVFIHDERSYGTKSLWTDELGEYQGPALYAYNNAAFTDDDWKGIQMAGRSVKRNDPNKVGRFGIGFNSVYHITDVPGIFSSGHLGLLDPQEKLFDRDAGFWWSLEDPEDQETLTTKHDQFQPFQDIVSLVSKQEWSKVVTEDKHFDGTIFRFPLRNKVSDISDNLYDSDKVVELFDSFIADADLSLLFLKNITSVSLKHIDTHGTVNTRLEVKSSVPTDVVLKSDEESIVEGSTRFKSITLNSRDHIETKWLLTTCTMKEGNVEYLDSLAQKLSFLPQVDLAFPLGDKREDSESRLSCFLPLPNNESNKTGLPVYVNACFGLTDNRRHIKWQEEDQKHDENAVWNELLMKEVLPQAYLMIIQDAIRLAQGSNLPVSSVYDLWPDIAQIKHKEKWYAVALDVLHHLFRHNVAVLSLAKDEKRFITPLEAVFPCNGPTSPDILAAIKRTLVSCGENLVTLPGSVARAINEAYPHLDNLKHVTPTFLRNILHKMTVPSISKEDKLCMLEYILRDGKYRELQGLPLLPVNDGSFRCFTDREEDTALIDSKEFPRALLPCCKHLFIPDDLSPACTTQLRELARKNLFKVINIDADQVAEYTRRFLPQDWKQMRTGLVTWDISNGQHPPSDWLQEFWKFLNTHFKELSNFTGMPLVPVSPLSVTHPVSLARLQQNTTLIFQKRKQMNLPEQIAQLMSKVGVTVVRGCDWIMHEDLDSYVLCPSPRSVMQVLMNLDSQDLIRELKTASHKAREELKEYLSSLDSLSGTERDLLSKLPLFQTMNGSCVEAQSRAVLLISGLTVPTDFPMPDSVVRCATEADRRLLQLLKVTLLDTANAANLLIDSIEKGNCRKEDTEKIMTWILQHGNNLFSQNDTLKRRCKDLSFIEVNGELKRTSSFFDPRIQTFKVIFGSDFFPPPVYTHTSQMLESLTDLGLLNKEVDVSPEHLLHIATVIDKMHVDSQTEALIKAQVFLRMLETNDLLTTFSHEQLCCLKKLKWVPCAKPGNDNKPCNDKSQKSFFCPDEIRHSMYKNIVGHVMPLVEFGERITSKLDLKRPPSPEKVIENLSVLTSKAKKMADPDTDVEFKTKLYSIYKHMQDYISEFAKIMNKDMRWVWSQNQFVSPHNLVLDYPRNLDLSSFIGKLPNEFLPYKKLLQKSGLRTMLSDEEIVGILLSIQKNIEGRAQPFASSSEIKVSVEILNWLWRERKTVQDDILVPVLIEGEQYTLKPLSSAVFCDVSKNGLKEINSQEEIHVVHEEILKATAEWLNIRFLSTYILDPEVVGIEQFGQSEPITTRIKNILKEYDEESDIFKELIQNAEDAGAESCKFLVDFRVHKDTPESLIDPDMTLCQGPCLWAFNNEQFTAEDWENIVRVGAASKEDKVEKIGKFGLGFNTVYHVTDVPSILSGNSLLILDPNVSHLKKIIKHKSNPGIKLDLSQQRLFHWFPGQFGPYQRIFDCNFTKQSPPEPYPGTLIKLPFRTDEEALKSEISKKVFGKQDIITFQQQFTEDSQTHLLFLKKINKLSLQSLSKDVSTPPRDNQIETILTVSKTTMSEMRIPDETIISKQHEAEKSVMKLNGKCTEIIDCCTVKIVQITSQQSGVTEVHSWLLYNCFGTQQSLKMVLQENKKTKFSLPIGGIAVPLQNDPETGKLASIQTDHVGQAFCFLPLSIHTGLPVNVNGTFAVTSNRKGLWDSGVKQDWNKALLQDPVVTAYVTALLSLKKMSENKQLVTYRYHTYWPDREKVSETFKPLVDAFYSAIAQQPIGPELFSDGELWCSMTNAIFLHKSIEEDKDIGELAVQVCKKHAKELNHVVHLPFWLRNSFRKAGLENVLENRTWNWEKFYQETVFKNLGTMDRKSRDTLVMHAIDLNIKVIDNLLVRYPCIPTKGGQLQYIKKLVNPIGKPACLFEPEEGRLLGGTKNDFCSPKRIQRLCELGMANEQLPLEEITLKAGTISKTWSTDKKKAYGHLKCLLELLKNHMNDKDSLHWETLRMTDFLPAFSPGDIKMERKVTLRRPTDMFSDKCSPLVNMTKPVLDCTNLKIHDTDSVLQHLGVKDSPRHETVLQQLQEVCEHSHSIDGSMLHEIAYECYTFLDQWVSDPGNSSLISQRANSFPFILVGSTFVNVNCVAEIEQFEVKPYLHVIPPAFTMFRRLWESVGVEKHFTISQFLNVLQRLHSQHGSKPLPKSDLLICLTIVNRGIFEAKEKTSDCLIPNEHGVLQPASEIFYDDSPWIKVSSGVTLCHEKIPRVVARHFGIKTTRHHTLENHEVEHTLPFAFQFEQQEQLTVRIKNIISAYPSKKDILKELLQNADDAEATEIHFVWDKRQHGKEKTFGKKWNHLQGPALCVFNNKVFSDADLAGIQQLGEGGKHNSPGKTGKYGVGFNSVYHLTDCPSILTGDKFLCISDPNKKYIESHSDTPKAGIGYEMAEEFKNMYNDVYKSFLPDEFALAQGTMFRLPLRIGTMANVSEISKQGVTDNDMKELCSALSEDPEGLILFLKNICKIKVHEINENSGKLKTIFMVEKSLTQKNREGKEAFLKLQLNALQSEKPIMPHKTIYQTMISTSDKRQSQWIIAEQFGSFKNSGESKTTSSDKLPQAAIAARVSLKPSSYICRDLIGEAFCSLPLPGKTGLPVHVNANFEVDSARRSLWKEDGKSKKCNWNETLKKNVIAPLYADLLSSIRCKVARGKFSYADLESCLDSSYLCFWPNVSKDVGQDWHEMILEVYRSIAERGLDVIPVLRSSTRTIAKRELKEYSFDWCNVTQTESTKAPHLTHSGSEELNPILEDLGMTLVPCSMKMKRVWNAFKSAGIKVKDVNPSTVQTFLREKPLNDPTQTDNDLPLPITATLIRDETRCSKLLSFCLKDIRVTNDNPRLLDGLPLLLTRDKVLRVFNSKSTNWISRYESLFIGLGDHLADYQTNIDHMNALQTLNLVKSLTVPCAVEYLKPIILHFLQNCEVDPHSGLHIPNKTTLDWLKELWKFFTSQIDPAQSSGLTLSDVRQLFNDSCIVPVVCPLLKNQPFLQAMKDMSGVIMFSSDQDISGILFNLGFMKLDSEFFLQNLSAQERSLLCPELMDVNNKSSVMNQVHRINHSKFSQLSIDDLKELQTFLQSGVLKSKDKQEYQRKLKSIPLFETIHGKRVRIDGPKEVFILSSTYSRTFSDLFVLTDSNSTFLKDNIENLTLSAILNIKILNDFEYFMKFILPVVHTLTESQMLQCLKLLVLLSTQHHDQYVESKDKIIFSLKTVKCIRNSQGKLKMASYYFDQSVELYRKMLPQKRFVPEKFWTELCNRNPQMEVRTKELLSDLGMKHVLSKEDIIKFAYQLESEAKGNAQLLELKQKSSLLFKAALRKVSEEKNSVLLESIADIKFIYPVEIKRELCNYHQPLAAERSTVQIRGSLMGSDDKHQELIWSSMPIIQLGYPSQKLLQLMENVGAHIQPPIHCVTKNMSNICQLPCKNEQLIKTRANVFRSSYAYLQAKEFKGQSLTGLPVVLVERDTELVRTENTAFLVPNHHEFRPYLFNISPLNIMFAEFFKAIGVKDRPTAVQYCNVLTAVYADSCDKQQLNPNQQKTAKRAVEQLFNLLKNQRNTLLVEDVKTLYLPAVDGKLYPSCTLYYNDTVFETSRLEDALENKFLLLEKLSECHLDSDIYEQHRLMQLLPQKFQPKMLSQFTEEKVVESHMQLCEFETDCEFSGWFDKHLSSEEFTHGLICLIRQQSQGEITQEDATNMCKKTFGSIKIVCCKSLETELWVDKQPLHKTATETDVFVKREQEGCIFYLKHNNDMKPKVINEVNMTLTKEINALLGSRIASIHLQVLGQLLMCDNLQDVQKTLAKNGICDSAQTNSSLLNPSAPGTDIPEEWHDSLDMNILNNFEEGEYVGYSPVNGKYIYAVIVEELPEHTGPLSRRYKVEIGEDEPIEVSCLDLYQIKRQKKPEPKGRTCTSAEASCMELEPLEGSAPHSSQPSTASSSSTRSSPASIDEAKREIDKCLEEIWTLPEDERHKALKRMYLRWHPDKNPDCQFLATEAFKYLQNQIKELSKGKGKTAGSSYPRGKSNFSNSNFSYSDFSDFFHQWDQEARHHRNGRERFSRGHNSYNFWSHNANVPRPNKEEAQRWFRQARCDLNAAYKDVGGGSTEWCLFKIHQAVEKSLIAACYKKCGQHPTSSSISTMAAQVSLYNLQLRVLPQIVKNLKTLGVDAKETQYPDSHPFPHIPNGQFRTENETLALKKASELLSKVEAYVS